MVPAAWQQKLENDWAQPSASVLARLLWPLSAIYAAAVALRRVGYRSGLLRSRATPVPVVVVGNWVAGGAGKTPAVIAIVEILRRAGFRPGVISRGYRGRSNSPFMVQTDSDPRAVGDEPLLIRRRCGVPVAIGCDRVAAARLLCTSTSGLDLLVADDGLQHLALRRHLEIVVVDARGFGNGMLLPAGPLRERPPSAPGSRTLVLYTGGSRSTLLPGFVGRRQISGAVLLADWIAGKPARGENLAALCGAPIPVAAGIAKPGEFFAMLGAAGILVLPLPLPDHHDFARLPWPASARDVIVTEKDAVKLDPGRTGATRVWVVPLDFEPEPGFADAVLAHLAS